MAGGQVLAPAPAPAPAASPSGFVRMAELFSAGAERKEDEALPSPRTFFNPTLNKRLSESELKAVAEDAAAAPAPT